MTNTEKLDLIVFGATGFTGKLVCEYLAKTYGRDISWGIAGRSHEKLNALVTELALDDNPQFIADVEDKASLDAMASACKVVLNTAGPYAKYGSNVVESCARLGTDHVDLNGEPLWMYEVLNQYEHLARDSGARIVFSCGFDSIPTDLGVQFLQEQAQSRFGRPLTRVKGRVRDIRGGASGGSIASFAATMEAIKARPELFAVLTNAFCLTPGFEGPEQPPGNEKVFEEDLNAWSGPFIMATINSKNLHRSNLLLGHPYGKDFVYDEMLLLGDSADGEGIGEAFEMNMDMKPGEGPSKEEQQAGSYEILYIGSNDEGDSLTVIVTGDKDPGYGSTCGMIAEAAICLSQKSKTKDGGILTPASAMGAELRDRVQANAGLTFTLAK